MIAVSGVGKRATTTTPEFERSGPIIDAARCVARNV